MVQGMRSAAKARYAGEPDGRGGDEAAAKDEGHNRYDEETRSQRRSISQEGRDSLWRELCAKMEEDVLEKLEVDEAKTGAYQERGEPLDWRGVGCDGFHPKVPLDLERETKGNVVEFLEKGTVWEMAATNLPSDVLLIPENLYERLIASMPTTKRLRNGNTNIALSGMPPMGVMEELDALCDLAGDGKIQLPCKRKEIKEVLDSAKAFERVSLPVVWLWATLFKCSQEDFACVVRVLRAPAASTV